MLGVYREVRNLQFQYPNWIICFAPLTNYLNRASIRATLFCEKLRPVAAHVKSPQEGTSSRGRLPGIEPELSVPQTDALTVIL